MPNESDLFIFGIKREINGITVSDELSIEKTGTSSVKITFIYVAPTMTTHEWEIWNIKNPPSTVPTSPFTNIIIVDILGDSVMSY